ncbi:MAG TPA: ATP-dependent Clp protease proteolytic subunit, partial [Ohtaekwangia sp.]|nr:ATP-dependent Clp protease proteolytic subunit [Ohtaekwangia sp.]
TWQEIESYFIRDRYMTAIEAKDFGLIDGILGDMSDVVQIQTGAMDVRMFNTLNNELSDSASS